MQTQNVSSPRAWPDGKAFAFTIFDDTDDAHLFNVIGVYECLRDLGFRTTKSVWPITGSDQPLIGGMTCEDPAYLDWILRLQADGFEIGLHNVTYHTSLREQTIEGLDRFRKLFGHDPYTLANHSGCDESIYWGDARLTKWRRRLYNLVLRNRYREVFQGHIESSPFFWGDVCKRRIDYVRNFVFGDINTLKSCPFMPYYDPHRPYVRSWFASSEGPNAETFVQTVSESSQDRLAEEGGACIMYTHLARGFSIGGKIHPRFRSLMQRLSQLNGWFVPVHILLTFLRRGNEPHMLTDAERSRLEWQWLIHKIRIQGSS